MKRYQIREQTPMRFHQFAWKVTIPLGVLRAVAGLYGTFQGMTYFHWLYLMDLFYYVAALGLLVSCFIGFFHWRPYAWYCWMAQLCLQVGYGCCCVGVSICYAPESLATYSGSLLGQLIYVVPVWIYYQKRKPLFFLPERMPHPPFETLKATDPEDGYLDLGDFPPENDSSCQNDDAPQCLDREEAEMRTKCDSARREKASLLKSARWLIAVLAVLCVVFCSACVVLLVQRSKVQSEEARLRETVEAQRLALQEMAKQPEPEPEPEPALSSEERLANAAESVIYLETYDENGECIASASGFLTGTSTLVTNYHVIQDAYEVYGWTTDDKGVMISSLLAYDEVADLAVLQCDWPPSACVLELADSEKVRQGLSVYAVGYPLGLANTMSDGIVSARYVDEYGIDTIQHTAAISCGSSGGPLLNGNGEVIGVVCAYYVDGQNLNLAVSSNTLKELLAETGKPLPLTEWTDRPLMPDQALWDEAEEETAPELEPEPEPEPAMVPTELRLNYDCCFVTLGESLNLVAIIEPSNVIANILWTSSDSERISVEDGTVTVKSISGASAIITAQTDTGLSATCKIIVKSDIQPYCSSSAGFVYEKYPEILSIENVVGDDQSIGFWSESDSDYTSTHFYTYQVKSADQAEAYVVAYVRFLVENGYVVSESNAEYYLYSLIDPTGTYKVHVRKEDPYYAHTLDVWISPVGN